MGSNPRVKVSFDRYNFREGLWLFVSEDIKIATLGHHLTEVAERYDNRQIEGWWKEKPAAVQTLLHTRITPTQRMKLFTEDEKCELNMARSLPVPCGSN